MKEPEVDNSMFVSFLVILGVIVVVLIAGVQMMFSECDERDMYGDYKYRDSFMCATENGRRLTAQEVNCREFNECEIK